MKFTEVIRIAWEAILKNKIRSFLTMLGIIIGVAAVIIMVAVSAGTEATISEQITSLGSNLLFVQSSFGRGGPPGSGGSGGLVFDDAAAIQDGVSGVKAVIVEQQSSQTVKADGNTLEDVVIHGSTSEFPSVRDMTVAQGRYFNDTDVNRKQKVAVLGSTLATNLFGTANPIGQVVTVGTTKLTVIGVMAPKGTVGDVDYDSRLYTPITVVFQKFTPSQFARIIGDRVRLIYVEVQDGANLTDVTTQIEILLAKRHNVTLDSLDFTVTSQQDIISTRESTTAAFRNLLAWVAGVSLIVGGIGIMNIMLVSVTERTREIGIRLAIGARSSVVQTQFLIEAIVLSLAGGAIGILLGIAISIFIPMWLEWPTLISPTAIVGSVIFSALVGIVFGFFPARKAAGLDPIEALRFE